MLKLARAVTRHLAHIKVVPTNLAYQGLSQVFARGSFILAGIVISRTNGIEVYGRVQYFYLTATTLATYLGLGLSAAATRFFAVDLAGASAERRQEMAVTLGLAAAVSVIMFFVGMGASDHILGSAYERLAFVFGSMVCALFAQGVLEGILASQRQFRHIFVLNVFSGLALLVAVYLCLRHSNDADDLIIAFNTVAVLACVAYLLILSTNKEIRGVVRMLHRCGTNYISSVLVLSVPMLLVGIVNATTPWLISRHMQQQGHSSDFAIFAISLQWFSAVLYFPLVITRVLAPEIVREIDRGNDNSVLLRSRVKTMGLIAAALAATVMAASPAILALYKTAESENIIRFCLMISSGIFASCMLPFASQMIASGLAWRWLCIQVGLSVLILTTYFLLANVRSPEGAFLLGYSLVFIYLISFDKTVKC